MNTSQFMDKQIMDLSSSQNKNNGNNDFVDLNNHPSQEEHDVGGGGAIKDEILPSYDFQPIRPLQSLQPSNFESSNIDGAKAWVSAESKTKSGIRNYGSLESIEPAKVVMEKDRAVFDAALISEIDKTMKKHADDLMHALEGVSARLSQLESRSRHMENSVDDLRTFVGNHHGNTDGKLRQIENMIREVQAGVLQVVKDKQEMLEAQLQLSQVQVSKVEQQAQPQITGHMESLQQAAASTPLQSHHQPPAALAPPLLPTLPNAPPPPARQNLASPVQHPTQFPRCDSYYPPSGQPAEAPPQQYQLPPPQAAPPSPQPQYQPAPHIQYSQPPPMSLQHPSLSSANPSQSHHSEESSYLQNYLPSIRQTGGPPPPQQFYGNPSQTYELPSPRTGSGFPSQYGPSPGLSEPYPYSGGSPIKSQQHSSPNMGGTSSGGGYPQLPTARILPHAVPSASAAAAAGGSGSGNRVPIDDVVDKVTNMGFPRDQVRATVRKLTENGQAVDLNVVLDKLMTDGVESQGPRAWFGR